MENLNSILFSFYIDFYIHKLYYKNTVLFEIYSNYLSNYKIQIFLLVNKFILILNKCFFSIAV